MTPEALTAELLSMRQQAEQGVTSISSLLDRLQAERRQVKQEVDKYNAKRLELLKHELQARGMTWCTYCREMVPESETALILIEGQRERSGGYGNSCYSMESFSTLHRTCLSCRERAQDRHGLEHFRSFHAEKRADGVYVRRFGHWVRLEEKLCFLEDISYELTEELTREWSLPPRMEFRGGHSASEDRLIIYDHSRLTKVG